MPEYAVTWQASEGVLVVVGATDVEVLLARVTGVLVTTTEEVTKDEVATIVEGTALLGTTVDFPPFKHVHALEIFAGTLDQRAAYAGKVWVGALVYAEQKGLAATANSSKTSRQASCVHVAVARS